MKLWMNGSTGIFSDNDLCKDRNITYKYASIYKSKGFIVSGECMFD